MDSQGKRSTNPNAYLNASFCLLALYPKMIDRSDTVSCSINVSRRGVGLRVSVPMDTPANLGVDPVHVIVMEVDLLT